MHSNRRPRRPCWLVVLPALVLTLAAALPSCGGTSPTAARLAQAIDNTVSAQSFHAVQTTSMELSSESVAARLEIYYQGPDRFRANSDLEELPFQEAVVIGSQAWTRSGGEWSIADPDTVRPVAAAVEAIRSLRNHEDLRETGAGPQVEGESTRRYVLSAPNYGPDISASMEEAIRAWPESEAALGPVRDAYRDVRASVELTVGEDTDRIYSVNLTLNGSEVSGQVTITIDMYDTPVTIEPPI